jgi:hypothetical protein
LMVVVADGEPGLPVVCKVDFGVSNFF